MFFLSSNLFFEILIFIEAKNEVCYNPIAKNSWLLKYLKQKFELGHFSYNLGIFEREKEAVAMVVYLYKAWGIIS